MCARPPGHHPPDNHPIFRVQTSSDAQCREGRHVRRPLPDLAERRRVRRVEHGSRLLGGVRRARDGRPGGLTGHGLTFTIGRGTEVCVAAIEALAPHDLVADLGGLWRRLVTDSQLRWLGPEKGVIHLATCRCSRSTVSRR
jgi:hypothetical protein